MISCDSVITSNHCQQKSNAQKTLRAGGKIIRIFLLFFHHSAILMEKTRLCLGEELHSMKTSLTLGYHLYMKKKHLFAQC